MTLGVFLCRKDLFVLASAVWQDQYHYLKSWYTPNPQKCWEQDNLGSAHVGFIELAWFQRTLMSYTCNIYCHVSTFKIYFEKTIMQAHKE